MSAVRICLSPDTWSPDDQLALQTALCPGLRRTRAGRAAKWRAPTILIMTHGVGCFLGFMAQSGVDILSSRLADICGEDAVFQWIASMNARDLMPSTVRFRVTGLQRGCMVMYPFADWQWLRPIVADLPHGRLESRQRKIKQFRHSRDLVELGLRLITASLEGSFLRPHLRHVHARDGMMIVLLAWKPLRLKNFTRLRLGQHLTRRDDGRWRIHVPASETKNSETVDDVLPEDIGSLLDRYLAVDRPELLARRRADLGAEEAHLWISEDGLPCTDAGIRLRIREQTFKAFGVAISPHRFRDAAVTTIAIEMPDQIRMALALLANRGPETILESYNMAATSMAAHRMNESIEATMRELGLKLS
jgi:integrase/recombinase XerD